MISVSGQARGEDGELTSSKIIRGTRRLVSTLGFSSVCELALPNGRRADMVAISATGHILIVEVKSCVADFRSDHKWREYLDYCDQLFFALATDGPVDLIPEDAGLIVADAYSAELLRDSPRLPVAPARRRAMLLAFARHAADRLLALQDPHGKGRFEI
ncbi:MAG: MmcB family DNA repair protein [Beijerinckiaceae bacterium]|nr:MmcB family DNA repair protein [Beijerinckiaceae bacterium]